LNVVEDHVRRDISAHAGSAHGASLWRPPDARAAGAPAAPPRPVRRHGLSFCILSGGGRWEKLRRLVASIRRQGLPAFEIIICGAANPGDGCRYVAAVDEVRSGAVSAVRNRAAEHARFDHIVFCDDDIELQPGWYAGLRPFLGEYDALTTRILNPDGTRHWDWPRCRGHHAQHLLSYDEIDRDLYLTGGHLIVRTDVWSRHRWNEDLKFSQAEDVDFTRRIIEAGHRVGICPDSSVVHADDRYTQVGCHVLMRTQRGKARLTSGELGSLPRAALLEIAAEAWKNDRHADAADCLRACRARHPHGLIANALLDDLYHLYGGRIEGNDDWRMESCGFRDDDERLDRVPATRKRTENDGMQDRSTGEHGTLPDRLEARNRLVAITDDETALLPPVHHRWTNGGHREAQRGEEFDQPRRRRPDRR